MFCDHDVLAYWREIEGEGAMDRVEESAGCYSQNWGESDLENAHNDDFYNLNWWLILILKINKIYGKLFKKWESEKSVMKIAEGLLQIQAYTMLIYIFIYQICRLINLITSEQF